MSKSLQDAARLARNTLKACGGPTAKERDAAVSAVDAALAVLNAKDLKHNSDLVHDYQSGAESCPMCQRRNALERALAAEQGQPTLDELKALWASEAITLQRERDELAALLEPRKRSNAQAIEDAEEIARLLSERDELIAALRVLCDDIASACTLGSISFDAPARALLARCEVK